MKAIVLSDPKALYRLLASLGKGFALIAFTTHVFTSSSVWIETDIIFGLFVGTISNLS